MKHITMDKIVTSVETVGNGMRVYTYKYKDMERELATDKEIKVSYRLGQKVRRTKQLTEIGFSLIEVIEDNGTEKHSPIIEIWKR